MIKRILILGGGSAGFIAALALKHRLPHLHISVIRSKDIGVIGVGEGSTPALTRFLHEYLRMNARKFFPVTQPTWKLGLRFLWGPRSYFNYTFSMGQLINVVKGMQRMKACYCWDEMEYEDPLSALMSQDRGFERDVRGDPIFHPSIAYHVENEKFVRFLEEYALALGVTILDDTVREVEQGEAGIDGLLLESGRREAADLYVDASGFRSLLLGQTLGNRLSVTAGLCSVTGLWWAGGTVKMPKTLSSSRIPRVKPWIVAGAGKSSTKIESTEVMYSARPLSRTKRPRRNFGRRTRRWGPRGLFGLFPGVTAISG